jgi:hypothetical protein
LEGTGRLYLYKAEPRLIELNLRPADAVMQPVVSVGFSGGMKAEERTTPVPALHLRTWRKVVYVAGMTSLSDTPPPADAATHFLPLRWPKNYQKKGWRKLECAQHLNCDVANLKPNRMPALGVPEKPGNQTKAQDLAKKCVLSKIGSANTSF